MRRVPRPDSSRSVSLRSRFRGSVDPWLLASAGLALYGVLGVLGATTRGVGVAPDSVHYLATARSVLDGHGFLAPAWDGSPAPSTHYPPLLPLVLAGLGRSGLGLLTAARALHALLFGATIVLVAGAINRFARPFTRAAFLGAALVATSVDLLSVHALALSEPLFIATALAGLSLLGGALERGRPGMLCGAAVVVGLAVLDRFIGVSLIAAGTTALLLARPWSLHVRVRRAACFLALAALPLGLWMLRGLAVAGTAADRHLVLHGVAGWQVKAGLLTISSWILPVASCCLGKPATVLLGGGVLLALLAALAVAARRRPPGRRRPGPVTTVLGGLFAVYYLGVLGVTMILVDAHQGPDERLLTPVFVAVVVMVFDLVRRLDVSPGGWGLAGRRATLTIGLALLVLGALAQARFVAHARAQGLAYNELTWQRSRTIERVRQLPADTPIYSNRPDAVRFLAGRRAAGVPIKRDIHTLRPNAAYPAELAALGDRLRSGQVVLVWLPASPWNDAYYPSLDEIENSLGIRALHREPDGIVYGTATSASGHGR
jgi:hypothetical protein